MGSEKDALFPYVEQLEQEFDEKHDREPTDAEREGFWKTARERFEEASEGQADSVRED